MEGHFISGYVDGGDAPYKELELVPGALDDANEFLGHEAETKTRFERVVGLIEGFESSFGLELLATVHWVVAEESTETLEEVIARTYAWKRTKARVFPTPDRARG